MNKRHAILALSLALVLSACNKTTAPNDTTTKNNTETKQEENIKGKFSLKSLLTQRKSLVCTYEHTDGDNKLDIKGTTYLSNQRMFQDTSTTAKSDPAKTVKTFTLVADSTVYIWSPDKKTQGMKIKFDPTAQNPEKVKTDVAGAQETMEKEYDLDCKPWKVDEKIFTLPTDVQFKDFSEMMNNLPKIPSLPAMKY